MRQLRQRNERVPFQDLGLTRDPSVARFCLASWETDFQYVFSR